MRSDAAWPLTIDVAIVGAGPAGAAAALMMARAGVAVALFDAGRPRLAVGETLPPASKPALHALGLAAAMAGEGHLPSVGSWSAWGGAEPFGRDFVFNRFGHGWHLDRRRFDALLRASAQAAGARVVSSTAVVASDARTGGGFHLHLTGGRKIAAQIVLDASGRAASFARQRGVRRHAIDRMVALVGYVARRPDAAAEPAATLVEAVPEGWWYSAPLPQDRLATVFMTDADLAKGAATSAEPWLDRLAAAEYTAARALRYGVGLAGPPSIVAAASSRLERFGDADWLALGDAAASQDPLSSEGILVAMQSGIDGAAATMRALGGDREALPAAAQRREVAWQNYLAQRADNYAMERRFQDAPFWQRRRAQGERRSVA